MERIIEYLKDSLAEHQPNYGSREVHSITEFLYWYYTAYNPVDTDTIRARFDEVNTIVRNLTLKEQDVIVDLVNSLCGEYEKQGFLEGLHIGARLTMELREMDREGA